MSRVAAAAARAASSSRCFQEVETTSKRRRRILGAGGVHASLGCQSPRARTDDDKVPRIAQPSPPLRDVHRQRLRGTTWQE